MLDSHKFVHGDDIFNCSQCPFLSKYPRLLRIHMRSVHGIVSDKPRRPTKKKDPDSFRFQCYVCKLKLLHLRTLRTHLHKKHAMKKCQVCDEEVVPTDRMHACVGEWPLTCEYCISSFHSLYALTEHLSTEHSESEKLVYVCDICRRKFRMRMLMDAHREKHTPGCFGCKECPEVFDTSPDLRKHERAAHPKIGSESKNFRGAIKIERR